MDKNVKVVSRDGKHEGKTTGREHRCQLEGCTGRRISVKWPNGKTTYPCSKGMDSRPDGSLQIL